MLFMPGCEKEIRSLFKEVIGKVKKEELG